MMDTLIGIMGSSLALGGAFLVYLALVIFADYLLKTLFHGKQGSKKT